LSEISGVKCRVCRTIIRVQRSAPLENTITRERMNDEFIGQMPKGHAGHKTLTRAPLCTITLTHVLAYDHENIKNIINDIRSEEYDRINARHISA